MSDKSLREKILLKPGKSLMLLNAPAEIEESFKDLAADCRVSPPATADVLLVFITNQAQLLEFLPRLSDKVNPSGIAWVAYPKLTSKQKSDIQRDSINTAAKASGWSRIAMISIDETWSALRLKVQ